MGKLIHVVEDDDDIRFIIEYVLTEAGYEVESSSTVQGFFESLKSHHPDLILLDVMLPDGTGIDICRTVRTNDAIKHIKIIMMSAHAAKTAVLEEACADDFISKPFDLDLLTERIKRFI